MVSTKGTVKIRESKTKASSPIKVLPIKSIVGHSWSKSNMSIKLINKIGLLPEKTLPPLDITTKTNFI